MKRSSTGNPLRPARGVRPAEAAVGPRLGLGFGAWGLAVVAGFAVLLEHGFSAGTDARPGAAAAAAAEHWLDEGKPTLLVFAHPECPCTPASLDEVERLLDAVGERVVARCFLFERERGAAGTAADPARPLRRGLETVPDPGGQIAARLGVETSGQVLLVAPGGRLLYSGGLTVSRGHAGESRAGAALREFLRGGEADLSARPVFGCSLVTPNGGAQR